MQRITTLTHLITFVFCCSSIMHLNAAVYTFLQDNKWTIASGSCFAISAWCAYQTIQCSNHEQEMLEREAPEDLARVHKEANPEVEKLVPMYRRTYRKERFAINWLNVYRNLHIQNKHLSERLVKSYYTRKLYDWASRAAGIIGLGMLFPALQEQKIIE